MVEQEKAHWDMCQDPSSQTNVRTEVKVNVITKHREVRSKVQMKDEVNLLGIRSHGWKFFRVGLVLVRATARDRHGLCRRLGGLSVVAVAVVL